MRNPHFDDGLVVWDDAYSGRYEPPADYAEQFDLQWKIALEGDAEYYEHVGASVEDDYIADRVYEWTGRHPGGRNGFNYPGAGARRLDHPLDETLIQGRTCIDIGCGMGRWTKTMLAIGAGSVLSIDMSASALASVARFNPQVRKVNIMNIAEEHPELVGQFEFANFWGVAMCTHDPRRAFMSAASTVKPGGSLYLMVYAPEGIHNDRAVNLQRQHFARLTSVDERLRYVDQVYQRRWDPVCPVADNLKNVVRNVLSRSRGGKVGVLDMLQPFYNWVIPYHVIEGWMQAAGFEQVRLLNEHEQPKCAFHVLGRKRLDAGGRSA